MVMTAMGILVETLFLLEFVFHPVCFQKSRTKANSATQASEQSGHIW